MNYSKEEMINDPKKADEETRRINAYIKMLKHINKLKNFWE